nr:hypothetical protein [Burkholderia lata]
MHHSGGSPGGDCTPDKLEGLQQEKNDACNQPRKCNSNMERSELFRRMGKNFSCAVARYRINNQCFAGGDAAHKSEMNRAFEGAALCGAYIVGKK